MIWCSLVVTSWMKIPIRLPSRLIGPAERKDWGRSRERLGLPAGRRRWQFVRGAGVLWCGLAWDRSWLFWCRFPAWHSTRSCRFRSGGLRVPKRATFGVWSSRWRTPSGHTRWSLSTRRWRLEVWSWGNKFCTWLPLFQGCPAPPACPSGCCSIAILTCDRLIIKKTDLKLHLSQTSLTQSQKDPLSLVRRAIEKKSWTDWLLFLMEEFVLWGLWL